MSYEWDNDPEAWRRAAHEELRELRRRTVGLLVLSGLMVLLSGLIVFALGLLSSAAP